MNKRIISFLTTVLFISPYVAAAAAPAVLVRFVNAIVNPAIYLMFALAALMFVWGVFQYVMNAESGDGRTKGGRHILWGLIGLTVMVCVYALIRIILSTMGAKAPDNLIL